MSLKTFWEIMDKNRAISCWYALRSWFEKHETLLLSLIDLLEKDTHTIDWLRKYGETDAYETYLEQKKGLLK